MVQKSCSSWDVYNPINNGIFTISTGDHRISPINSSTWTFFSRFFLPVQHRFVCSRRRFRGCVWLVILYLFFYDGKNHHCSPPFWEYFLFSKYFRNPSVFFHLPMTDLYQMKVNTLNILGGFKYFLCSPLLGEDSHVDEYFSDGLVQPPTSKYLEGKKIPLTQLTSVICCI